MLITHNRDIIVRILQSAKHQVITYTIPIYTDKPKSIPTIEIKEHEMILTFNPILQQNLQALRVSNIPFGKSCTNTSSPSVPPSVSKTEKTSALS
jgi:hypothetical protein